MKPCPYAGKCGGCDYQGIPYEKQRQLKQKTVEDLLRDFCPVHPITGMKDPYHYRNKVHAVFSRTRDGRILTGMYEENSHRVVPTDACQIENEKAQEIIHTIRDLIPSFKITVYNETSGFGLLRHVLSRTGARTGEILVVLVVTGPVFPSKNNFVKVLRKKHPEITSIVLNINSRKTSMVLGTRDIVLFGPGFIEDEICGMRFRISAQSFYQVNPVQAEKLYEKAVELAGLTGKERIIDAYCGTGTIGLIASKSAAELVGVELNAEAVKDAVKNARKNHVENARFVTGDAGEFMRAMAKDKEHADVLFMDPPRSGASEEFLRAAALLSPSRIVYISCGPESLARDLAILQKLGYRAKGAWGYDLFGFTKHVEVVTLLQLSNRKPDAKIRVDVNLEDYYRIKDNKQSKES